MRIFKSLALALFFSLPLSGYSAPSTSHFALREGHEHFALRHAQKGDAEKVSSFIQRIRGELGFNPSLGTQGQKVTYDSVAIQREFTGKKGRLFLLLNEKNEIILTTGYTALDATTCEIKAVYLDKRYRGQGIASQILKKALSEIDAKGFKRVILKTNPLMTDAIALYTRYGFKADPNEEPGFFYRGAK